MGFPGGMAKIMPVFGLEVDFDITPVFNAVVNFGRMHANARRKDKCKMCWVGTGGAGKSAFCNLKGYVQDFNMKNDDECMLIGEGKKFKDMATAKKACESPMQAAPKNGKFVPQSRLAMLDTKAQFIDAEQFCKGIEYTRVNADKPPRYLLKPLKRAGPGAGVRGFRKDGNGKGKADGKGDAKPKKMMLLDMGEGTTSVPVTLGNMLSPFRTDTPSTGLIESI